MQPAQREMWLEIRRGLLSVSHGLAAVRDNENVDLLVKCLRACADVIDERVGRAARLREAQHSDRREAVGG